MNTRTLVAKRLIDAPVETVWRYWTQPELVQKWWGPEDFTSPSCRIDLRVGGLYIFAMLAPAMLGGQLSFTSGRYRDIQLHRRLEFTQGLSDEQGQRIDPVSIGMPPEFPAEVRTVVTFTSIRSQLCELTVTEHDWPHIPMYVFAALGLEQSLNKLVDGLAAAAGGVQ